MQHPEASYDFSSNDPYPYPRYTDDWFNSHGTRCAGEVSAKRDNNVCGVGVAYNSRVAGTSVLISSLRVIHSLYMCMRFFSCQIAHRHSNVGPAVHDRFD